MDFKAIYLQTMEDERRAKAQERSDKQWAEFLCGDEIKKIFALQEANRESKQGTSNA